MIQAASDADVHGFVCVAAAAAAAWFLIYLWNRGSGE